MNKFLLPGLVAAMALLAGCSEKHSVEDFTKDAKLRSEWIQKCQKGEIDVTNSDNAANCSNAAQAEGIANTGAPATPAP